MRIHLLLTGNELMNGDIVDSNSAMIAQKLSPFGLGIEKKVTVGDDLPQLIAELRALSADADVLLVNGGLGPTVDDLTAVALAQAANVDLQEHTEAMQHLDQWCAERHIALNDANRKQALLPAGCELIPNPIGSAVGFALNLGRCRVMCTPGVPRELEQMLDQTIVPQLASKRGTVAIRKMTFFGIGESSLQQLLAENMPDWPQDVELGFRAGFPLIELKLTTRQQGVEPKTEALQQRIIELAGEFLVGTGATTLPESVISLLSERGQHVCLAESCTGGLIASQLTRVPGSSQIFEAGYVTYSNAMKTKLLGVDPALLAEHGAVSEPVVRAMAEGALQHSGADYAISVSGIAGPEGGSEDKPVGTVWIGWGDRQQIHAHRFNLRLPRAQFQDLTATIALDLLRRHILGINAPAALFRERR